MIIYNHRRLEPSEEAAQFLRARADIAKKLLDLAEYLPDQDRALLQGVYERGMRPIDFARAIRARPRTIRHRVRGLVERVTSPLFQFVATQPRAWTNQRRIIAELTILRGKSQRDVAHRLGLSLHRVRPARPQTPTSEPSEPSDLFR